MDPLKRVQMDMAMVLSSLHGMTDTFGVPASILYLALGSDLERWELVKRVAVGAGLIEVSGASLVKLTAKGKPLAKEFDAAINSMAKERGL